MLDKLNHYLENWGAGSSRIYKWVSGILITAIMLITVVDVFMRRILNNPLRPSMELTELLIGVAILLAIAYCGVKKGHVFVDFVFVKFSRRLRKNLLIIMHILAVAMCGVFTWQMARYAISTYDGHEHSLILSMPLYPFIIIGSLSFLFLALSFLQELIVTIKERD
jgi:TRAP-type C4-dicarboxylate transport system permease small subunit